MKKSALRPIRSGDMVACDAATQNHGKVHLGDDAPVFVRRICSGDKVVRDAATQNHGKVHLGDDAPVFGR